MIYCAKPYLNKHVIHVSIYCDLKDQFFLGILESFPILSAAQ